jgi:uncharacterized protein DUF3866
MTRVALRRGVVTAIDSGGPVAQIRVRIGGEERPAIAYVGMTGPVEEGDDVVVNVAARDLGLGSGGFDIVHVNLTRGLDAEGEPGAHVMKLNYSSLQHTFDPIEALAPGADPTRDAVADPAPGADQLRAAAGMPVAVIGLHAQLPCVAWAVEQLAAGPRIGFVQTWGGALPGALSEVVRELRRRGLLAGHITAGQAFGGEHDAVSVEGAIHAGLTGLGWEAAIVGPGPGILGSATALGHGGMAALESAHAALALGCRPIVVPRMSSGDPRARHQGISHHTATVLELLLAAVDVALPAPEPLPGAHRACVATVDLDGYRGSGLPAGTMGRGIDEDELFFRAALAGGAVLAEAINGVRAGRH